MAGGQAIEGKRGVLFQIDPKDVDLAGIDYQSGPEDAAYNPRNKDPVDEAMIESIMRLGVLEPIGVIKVPHRQKPVVLFGNQRIRAAREANQRLKAAGKDPVTVSCLSPLRGFDQAELSEAAVAENEIRRESSPLVKSASPQALRRQLPTSGQGVWLLGPISPPTDRVERGRAGDQESDHGR
jgi:hypothetical protein